MCQPTESSSDCVHAKHAYSSDASRSGALKRKGSSKGSVSAINQGVVRSIDIRVTCSAFFCFVQGHVNKQLLKLLLIYYHVVVDILLLV